MKKIISLKIALVLAAAGILAACSGSSSPSGSSSSSTSSANQSAVNTGANTGALAEGGSFNYMKTARQNGMFEAELGKLATIKAQNPEIKQFGQKIAGDYDKIETDLKSIAARKKIELPTELTSEQKEKLDQLSKLSGADFDKEYVEMMLKNREADANAFQAQAASSSGDADVKDFAARNLPSVKAHLQTLENFQNKKTRGGSEHGTMRSLRQ